MRLFVGVSVLLSVFFCLICLCSFGVGLSLFSESLFVYLCLYSSFFRISSFSICISFSLSLSCISNIFFAIWHCFSYVFKLFCLPVCPADCFSVYRSVSCPLFALFLLSLTRSSCALKESGEKYRRPSSISAFMPFMILLTSPKFVDGSYSETFIRHHSLLHIYCPT